MSKQQRTDKRAVDARVKDARAKALADLNKSLEPIRRQIAANRKFNRWLAERGLLASAVPPLDESGRQDDTD